MKKKVIIIGTAIIVMVLVVLRLAGNYSKIQEKKSANTNTVKAVSVTTEQVKRSELSRTIKAVGSTIAKTEVNLQAEISAQVTAVEFSLGDYVKKGQLLVKLDDRMQVYALENAKLNLSKQEDEYGRMKNIYAGKAGTETQLRDARIAYEAAKIAVEQAKRQLDLTRITAPFDGIVYQKSVEKGGYVGMGTVVLGIIDIKQLKVALNIAETDAYVLKNGQTAEITSSVFPGTTFPGRISFIAPKADKWHNYAVEVVLENNKNNALRAGTFVSVAFQLGSSKQTLVIPRKSLLGSMKDASVYRVVGGKAVLTPVTIGQDYGEALEVINGVSENDIIVTTGHLNLTDGLAVQILK